MEAPATTDNTGVVAALIGAIAALVAALIGVVSALYIAVWGQRKAEQEHDRQRELDRQEHDEQRHAAQADERWRRQDQLRKVRILLSAEIEHNLRLVRRLQSIVRADGEAASDNVQRWEQMRQRLARWPLAEFSRLMWESQASLLSAALDAEQLPELFDHYSALSEISVMRSQLTEVEAEFQAEWKARADPFGQVQTSQLARHIHDKFAPRMATLWLECDQLMGQVLKRGNPLNVAPQDSVEGQC